MYMVFQEKFKKSTWCIACAHSLVDSPNPGNEITCEALQRLDMVGKDGSETSVDLLPPGSTSFTILPLNLARGLEFLNYQIRMKRWETPGIRRVSKLLFGRTASYAGS